MTQPSYPPPRKAKWRGYAVNILLLILLIIAIRVWQQRDMIHGVAPALQGLTLAGLPYTLSAHPGKPVLIHFWATWCSICRLEQGTIDAIAQEDVNVITVAMQSGPPEDVSRHMRDQKLSFPVVNDPYGDISRAWGVHAVPASFVVSPDGQIRFVEVGYTTAAGLRLRLWLAGI